MKFLCLFVCLLSFGAYGAGMTPYTNRYALYVDPYGSDTKGAKGHPDLPFASIMAAKAAAAAGDTIFVNPGNYTNQNNLLKAGVNYFFYPGATIYFKATNASPDGYGIFDDRTSGATTNIIGGAGNFYYDTGTNGIADNGNYLGNTNALGLMVVTNANTSITFKFDRLRITSINFGGILAAIHVKNCQSFYAEGNDIDDPAYGTVVPKNDVTLSPPPLDYPQTSVGIYWELGDIHVRVKRLAASQYGVWCVEPVAQTSSVNGYFQIDHLVSKVYTTCKSQNYKCWFDVQDAIMRDTSGSGNGTPFDLAEGGGFFYVRAMKLGAAGPDPALRIANGVTISNITVWLDAQKISSTNHWIEANGGFVRANIGELEDPAGTVTNGIQVSATGNLRLRGGVASAGNNIFAYAGGKLDVAGMELRSTNTPVATLSGAGVGPTFSSCVLIPNSNSNSIYATTAQPVRILGGAMRTAVNANVTVTGPTYTDATLQ